MDDPEIVESLDTRRLKVSGRFGNEKTVSLWNLSLLEGFKCVDALC